MPLIPKPSSDPKDPRPDVFVRLRGLDDEINRNICQSEIAGGVYLADLEVGDLVEVETKNRIYFIENCGNGKILMSGHPKYCPQPTPVRLHGSTWGGSSLKLGFIGRGMRLEFSHPAHGVIRTSQIREIRQLQQAHQFSPQLLLSAP